MSSTGDAESAAHGSWRKWHRADTPIRLGVSSCLLGQNVRHDGGHARDRYVTDVLGEWVDWVPICPEAEIGMGTPRPTVRIMKAAEGLKLIAPSTGEDFTQRMNDFSAQRTAQLADIDGYVLKKNSPSCGLERVRIYRDSSAHERKGRGLFAAALTDTWPGLPVEEEGRLNDPPLRENFIERLFCRNRWRAFVAEGPTIGRLVEFHTAHKLLLRAHDERGYRELGQLVSGSERMPEAQLYTSYEQLFQKTLERKTTRRKHANVLQHAMGYLKRVLEPIEKRELLQAIEDMRLGLTPLIVPLTLLRFNVAKHGVDYLDGQLYFEPHPKELMLRNHV